MSLLFCFFLVSCATNGAPDTLDKTEILAIAQQAVADNDTWVDRAQFEAPRLQSGNTWKVDVWRIPKVPGGYRTIAIDGAGKVTGYVRGY